MSKAQDELQGEAALQALLAWVGERLGPKTLDSLADGDYGQDTKAHRAALARLATGDLEPLRPMRPAPGEVLALARWNPVAKNAPAEEHWRRLFSCVALLIAASFEENRGRTFSVNESLAGALESLLAVCPEQAPALLALVDRLESIGAMRGEEVFAPLARLVVEAHSKSPPEVLGALLAEAEARATARPLLGRATRRRYGRLLEITAHDLRHELWGVLLDKPLKGFGDDPEYAALKTKWEALALPRRGSG